jgi:hypothetical protein
VFTYRSRLLWPGALVSLAVLVPLTLAARARTRARRPPVPRDQA